MNEVIVELEERSYPIFVGNGLLKTIDGLIGEHLAGRSHCPCIRLSPLRRPAARHEA